MSNNSNQENTNIKRHDSQHNNISQTNSQTIQDCLKKSSSHMINITLVNVIAMREKFDKNRHEKDENKCQHVHAQIIVARPTWEENLSILSPEKCHVHHHVMVVLHHHPTVRKKIK